MSICSDSTSEIFKFLEDISDRSSSGGADSASELFKWLEDVPDGFSSVGATTTLLALLASEINHLLIPFANFLLSFSFLSLCFANQDPDCFLKTL